MNDLTSSAQLFYVSGLSHFIDEGSRSERSSNWLAVMKLVNVHWDPNLMYLILRVIYLATGNRAQNKHVLWGYLIKYKLHS